MAERVFEHMHKFYEVEEVKKKTNLMLHVDERPPKNTFVNREKENRKKANNAKQRTKKYIFCVDWQILY